MVKQWLRRLILWALEDVPPAVPADCTQSVQLYEEWLHGALTGRDDPAAGQ